KLDAERPTSIAGRAQGRLVWGDAYGGRFPTEASLRGITVEQQREAWRRAVVPDGATLVVGGDLSLDEIVPRLEARLGAWKPTGTAPAQVRPEPRPPGAATLYVVDKPGAAQSVLASVLPTLTPDHPDHFALYMGNTALGGAFTARINMNLREDKGYTYGARCALETSRGPEVWSCSASVATNVTIPAFKELRREIEEAVTTRPITQDEIGFFQSYRVNAFQGSYETPSDLLTEIVRIRTLGLPADWLERYVPGVESVDASAANAALQRWLRADQIAYVIVGDRARFAEELAGIDLPIVALDRDGNPLE
ncbi:MAG TPA: insulinase family protein, partial [Myxococcota bacterium]|nr:insulinase family protein [Myxococcota bacterium]